jgi:hypothetical protein
MLNLVILPLSFVFYLECAMNPFTLANGTVRHTPWQSPSYHVFHSALAGSPSFVYTSPSTPTPNIPSRKRKRSHDENALPSGFSSEAIPAQIQDIQDQDNAAKGHETKKRAYSARLSADQKLEAVFACISETAKWSLDEFLYYTFRLQDKKGNEAKRSHRHAAFVSKYFASICLHSKRPCIESYFGSTGGEMWVSGIGCICTDPSIVK